MECDNAIANAYSDELLRAVGVLFITTAFAENALSFALARVVSHPNKIRTYEMMAFQGMEAKIKLEKIAVAVHMQKRDRAPEVKKLCDKIRSSFQRRNEIAHNADLSYDPGELELAIMRFKSDGDLAGNKLYKPRQILGLAAVLRARTQSLDELLTDMGFVKTSGLIE